MRAINANIMRQINRKLLLNEIRLRPISRAELAEVTQLTRASVTQIIDELINEGIVIETAVVGRSRLGRRSTQLAITPDSRVFFGVYLGSHQCDVGAINLRGDILLQSTDALEGCSADEVIESVHSMIVQMKARLNLSDECIGGIGLCAPGSVNAPTLSPQLAQMLAERTGYPVYAESAANARALDECYFGFRDDSFALVHIDECVRTGVIVNGKLYRGSFADMDLGGIAVDIEDCSRRLDQYISIPALLEGMPWRSWSELMDNAADPAAITAIERLIKYLTFAALSLVTVLGLRRIVLTGALTDRAEHLVRRINQSLSERLSHDTPILVVGAQQPSVRLAALPALHTFYAN